MRDSDRNGQDVSWSRYRVIFDLFARDVSTLPPLATRRFIHARRRVRRSSRGVSTALKSYSGGLWWEQLPMLFPRD